MDQFRELRLLINSTLPDLQALFHAWNEELLSDIYNLLQSQPYVLISFAHGLSKDVVQEFAAMQTKRSEYIVTVCKFPEIDAHKLHVCYKPSIFIQDLNDTAKIFAEIDQALIDQTIICVYPRRAIFRKDLFTFVNLLRDRGYWNFWDCGTFEKNGYILVKKN